MQAFKGSHTSQNGAARSSSTSKPGGFHGVRHGVAPGAKQLTLVVYARLFKELSEKAVVKITYKVGCCSCYHVTRKYSAVNSKENGIVNTLCIVKRTKGFGATPLTVGAAPSLHMFGYIESSIVVKSLCHVQASSGIGALRRNIDYALHLCWSLHRQSKHHWLIID